MALNVSARWSALTYPLVAGMVAFSFGFCWLVRIDERLTAVVRWNDTPAGACVDDPFPPRARAALHPGAELDFTPLATTQVDVVVVEPIERASGNLQLCAHRVRTTEPLAGITGTLSITLGRERLLYRLCPPLKAVLGG